MKFHLVAAVLSCALLSLSCADVAETEEILSPLVEVPQHVDSPAAVVAKPVTERPTEVPLIPEPVLPAAGEQIKDQPIEEAAKNTEAVVVPQTETTVNNRESRKLIGFIPSYVLRRAIRMGQPQQHNDVRSFMNNNLGYGSSDEVAEERSVRRRKRFRTRTSNDHLKTTRRHNNSNRQSMNRRKNVSGKRTTQNRRRNTQNVMSKKKTRRPSGRVRNKPKKGSKRGY